MDIMLILQFIVLLGGIYLGVKLGGMGIGYAGGVGVIVLTLVLGMKTEMKHIPTDVILIIASVISAISAMQVAGGLDWLFSTYRYIFAYYFCRHRTHGIFYDTCYRRRCKGAKYKT